jgi:hypothetical protein
MTAFICSMKKQGIRTATRSSNGYGTWLALLCFGLLIQIVSLVGLYTVQSAYLLQCSRQSRMDLSCMSYARHMIENNAAVRRCHYDESREIQELDAKIGSVPVHFTDRGTYIECSYPRSGKTIVMEVYYENSTPIDIEYNSY